MGGMHELGGPCQCGSDRGTGGRKAERAAWFAKVLFNITSPGASFQKKRPLVSQHGYLDEVWVEMWIGVCGLVRVLVPVSQDGVRVCLKEISPELWVWASGSRALFDVGLGAADARKAAASASASATPSWQGDRRILVPFF